MSAVRALRRPSAQSHTKGPLPIGGGPFLFTLNSAGRGAAQGWDQFEASLTPVLVSAATMFGLALLTFTLALLPALSNLAVASIQ